MISIAPPEEKDMMGVQQVFYKTWLDTYPNEELGITKEDIEDRYKGKFTDEVLAQRWEKIQTMTDRKMLLAKDGEIVAGLIMITQGPGINQLQAIYVLPEYQAKGIGKKLWDEAQKYIDESKQTIVQVATYNSNAIKFYEKLGFKDNGKRWEDEKLRMKSGAIIPQIELIKEGPTK